MIIYVFFLLKELENQRQQVESAEKRRKAQEELVNRRKSKYLYIFFAQFSFDFGTVVSQSYYYGIHLSMLV
jgi:outer membrane protein TolC